MKAENPPQGHLFLAFLFFLGHLLAARRSCQVPSPADQPCAWDRLAGTERFSGPLSCGRRAMGHPVSRGWRDVNAQSRVARSHGTWTTMEIKVVTQQKKGLLSTAQPVNPSSSSLALSGRRGLPPSPLKTAS